MSLSRKHFEAIAEHINHLMNCNFANLEFDKEPFIDFVEDMIYMCKQDNPNFDRDKFIKACGFENGLYPDENE
tara:strand:+ start:362 stop:580 length:219 start_codon:yes stop_codon:yes gene_type:complete